MSTVEGVGKAPNVPDPGTKVFAWWRGGSRAEKYGRPFLSVIFWFYVIGQLVFADLDHWLILYLPGAISWIITYKFLFFLAVSALIINFVPRKTFWLWAAFIGVSPLVLSYRLVKVTLLGTVTFLAKLNSWPLIFTTLNVLFTFVQTFKINYLVYVTALIAVIAIAISDSPATQQSAAYVIAGVIVVLIARRIVAIFSPPPIFNIYVKAVARLMDYGRRSLMKPTSLRGAEIELLSREDLDKQYGNVTKGVFMVALCDFLEQRFKDYQSSRIAMATYLFGLTLLFVLVVFLLTVANLGIYGADSQSFNVIGDHKLFLFFYYSFGLITGQHISEVLPVTLNAQIFSMFGTILGWFFFAGAILSLYLAIRKDREDEGIRAAMHQLKEERQQMSEFVENGYSLPFEDILVLLEKVQGGLGTITSALRKATGR